MRNIYFNSVFWMLFKVFLCDIEVLWRNIYLFHSEFRKKLRYFCENFIFDKKYYSKCWVFSMNFQREIKIIQLIYKRIFVCFFFFFNFYNHFSACYCWIRSHRTEPWHLYLKKMFHITYLIKENFEILKFFCWNYNTIYIEGEM